MIRQPRYSVALPAMLLAATLHGCAPPGDRPTDPDALPLLGTVPITPLEKVAFVLDDTEGHPFDFREQTDGHITLLFFGYTYCPDVCPVHMATLSAALREVAPEVREMVRVVFVSVDPARDTPERLRQWLSAFDPSFVGVRGNLDDVTQALAFYRYPPPAQSGEEVGYTVGHPAYIYAFTPDDLGRGLYGVETTRATWVHDLKLMAAHDWSGSKASTRQNPQRDPQQGRPSGDTGLAIGDPDGDAADAAGVLARTGAIEVLDAVVAGAAEGDNTSVYLTLRNGGETADALLSLETDAAEKGSLHRMRTEGGVMTMEPMDTGLLLPPGETVTLAPGARHGMLEGLRGPLEPGSTLRLTLRFAQATDVAVEARVVRYDELH